MYEHLAAGEVLTDQWLQRMTLDCVLHAGCRRAVLNWSVYACGAKFLTRVIMCQLRGHRARYLPKLETNHVVQVYLGLVNLCSALVCILHDPSIKPHTNSYSRPV